MDTPGSNAQAPFANILHGPKAALFPAPPADLNGYRCSLISSSFHLKAAAPNEVAVVLAVSEEQTRQHIGRVLKEADLDIRAKTSVDRISVSDIGADQTKVLAWLQGHFAEGDSRPLILISDLLKPPSELIEGFLTRECQARFARHALGTIGILPSQQRVTDIDRIIKPDVTRADLINAMALLIARLEYLTAPTARPDIDPDSIIFRPLRSDNEREFREYFGLRHRVYVQMGYLDEEMEASPSKLEMNEADTHSIHLGAFYRSRCGEVLIGSARVATNDEVDSELVELFEKIAEKDPVSKHRLNDAYPLSLPIFQTHKTMAGRLIDIIRNRQKCGELSRVIVDRSFRGAGISDRLITAALERAVGKGINPIFLECLKIHQQIYEKHGFKRLDGVEASVIDVKRTMIAMELQPQAIAKITARLSDISDGRRQNVVIKDGEFIGIAEMAALRSQTGMPVNAEMRGTR
jgi:predicted GNAT family N-acyltransferase